MNLTRETIDQICEYSRNGRIIEAIKELRYAWPIGLREAKDLIDQYRSNSDGLRKVLLDIADIKHGAVFENSLMRIEIKDTGASFQEIQSFLIQVLAKLYPNLTLEDLQQFCQNIVSLHGRPSIEKLQELSESLFDRFYPELSDDY